VTSKVSQERPYRADIDGLRAIAILSVVAFHVRLPFSHGGFIGVDIFLVISGYLIGSLVYRDICASNFSIVRFYQRRVKRILPALFFVLVFVYVIAFVFLSPSEISNVCAEAIAAVSSSSNIYYLLRSDYFGSGAEFKPLLMTWSLGIEEQFYLFFPLALLLLHRYAKRILFPCIVIATLLSFISSVVYVHFNPAAAFYLLPMRAWELGIGVILALHEAGIQRDGGVVKRRWANALGWSGFALIAGSLSLIDEHTGFPGFAASFPVLGTACLIMAPGSIVNRKVLSLRPMVFIGLVSYSWYLWHWPLLSFARIVTGGQISVSVTFLVAIVSLLVACLSHRFIELPFRRSVTRTAPLFTRYAVLAFLLVAVPLVGYMRQGWTSRAPEPLLRAEAAARETKTNSCVADYGSSTPRLTEPCVIEGKGPKLALLGDSHAASLGIALKELAIRNGYGFEELAKSACPSLSRITRFVPSHPGHDAECAAFNRAVLNRLLNDHNITVVVLAGYWSAAERYTDPALPRKDISEDESYDNLHSGLKEVIALLRRSGKRVFVATDVPRFEFEPLSNVRSSEMRWRRSIASLLSSRSMSLDPVLQNILIGPAYVRADKIVRQAAAESGAQILDLDRNLCKESHCRFWDSGVLLYADSHHLTNSGAEYALRGWSFL
jgi:peptidoglycan/LPS O-acetylase OafA/YrhL